MFPRDSANGHLEGNVQPILVKQAKQDCNLAWVAGDRTDWSDPGQWWRAIVGRKGAKCKCFTSIQVSGYDCEVDGLVWNEGVGNDESIAT